MKIIRFVKVILFERQKFLFLIEVSIYHYITIIYTSYIVCLSTSWPVFFLPISKKKNERPKRQNTRKLNSARRRSMWVEWNRCVKMIDRWYLSSIASGASFSIDQNRLWIERWTKNEHFAQLQLPELKTIFEHVSWKYCSTHAHTQRMRLSLAPFAFSTLSLQ